MTIGETIAQGVADKKRVAVRQLLRRWAAVPELCREKETELKECKMLVMEEETTLGAQVITGMPGGCGETDPTAGNLRVKNSYCTRIRHLGKEIRRLREFERSMDAVTQELPIDQQKVIALRYKRQYKWGRVAQQMGYTVRRAQQLEAEAVDFASNRIKVFVKFRY